MRTKYATLRKHELLREIDNALQKGDEIAYRDLLQEVLNRAVVGNPD